MPTFCFLTARTFLFLGDDSLLRLNLIWTGQVKILSRCYPAYLRLEMIMIKQTIGDTPYPYFL